MKARTPSEYEIDTFAVKTGEEGVISFVHKRRRPSAVIGIAREEDNRLKPPGRFGNYMGPILWEDGPTELCCGTHFPYRTHRCP